MMHFDESQSPVMNSASSSESVNRQLSDTFCVSVDNQMSASSNEQKVGFVELATPSDQTAIFG